jgi:hypothetical protein
MNHKITIERIRTLLKNSDNSTTIKSYLELEMNIISDDLGKNESPIINHFDEIDKALNSYPSHSKKQEDAVVNAVFLILTEHFLGLKALQT